MPLMFHWAIVLVMQLYIRILITNLFNWFSGCWFQKNQTLTVTWWLDSTLWAWQQEKGLACWVADVRSKDLPLVFISSFGRWTGSGFSSDGFLGADLGPIQDGNLQIEPGYKSNILDWLIDLFIFSWMDFYPILCHKGFFKSVHVGVCGNRELLRRDFELGYLGV